MLNGRRNPVFQIAYSQEKMMEGGDDDAGRVCVDLRSSLMVRVITALCWWNQKVQTCSRKKETNVWAPTKQHYPFDLLALLLLIINRFSFIYYEFMRHTNKQQCLNCGGLKKLVPKKSKVLISLANLDIDFLSCKNTQAHLNCKWWVHLNVMNRQRLGKSNP